MATNDRGGRGSGKDRRRETRNADARLLLEEYTQHTGEVEWRVGLSDGEEGLVVWITGRRERGHDTEGEVEEVFERLL